MNRTELVDAVGERLGDRRTAAAAVEAVLDTVTAALSDGQKVALFGFGVFEKVDRAARTARNPATGGTVEVPATSVPRFRPGQALKDAVNGRTSGATQRTAARAVSGGADAAVSRAKAGTGTSGSTTPGGRKAETGAAHGRRATAGPKSDSRKPGSKKPDGNKSDSSKSDSKKSDSKKSGSKKADSKKSGSKKSDSKKSGSKKSDS